MRDLFQDLLAIDGVKGVVFFSLSGQPVFEEFTVGGSGAANAGDWLSLAKSLGKAQEAELVFEKGRLYVRRGAEGFLVVVMGLMGPTGMVRLTSDILLSGLREPKPVRGLKRFFKR
jgi:hypothetical protein